MSHKDFVVTWVEAHNKKGGVAMVARKLNISTSEASAKANYLRRIGVNLPKMVRAKANYTVDDLNALIEAKTA